MTTNTAATPKTTANTEAAEAPVVKKRRGSRVDTFQGKMVTLLRRGAQTVEAMAKKFDVPERDIRLAIDRARGGAAPENIVRVAKNTFQIKAEKTAAK